MLLQFFFLINFFALFFIISLPKNLYKIYTHFALWISWILFFLSLLIWFQFNKFDGGYQILVSYSLVKNFQIYWIFGIDGISLFFIILTASIIPICFIFSWTVIFYQQYLVLLILIINFLLVLAFSALDLFLFCVWFESLLIPIVFLILIWGTRERKIKALIYLYMYTIFGSIFLLLSLFCIYSEIQSTLFFSIITMEITNKKELLVWFCLFLSFSVKIPIFPFHIWLPEAHVEAPTIGSVILAGLLLKLGGYGILRFLFWFPTAFKFFQPLVLTLCILSIIYASFIALCQVDIKKIIAYSSIAHINFAILGLFTGNIYGIIGAVLLFISHGIVSSALFLLIGILYSRFHTRNILYYSGSVHFMPLFTGFFFLFIISNFSFPGTSNFCGELLIIIGLGYSNYFLILILITFTTILTVIYSLLLFNTVCFGTLSKLNIFVYYDLTRLEFFILLPLTIFNILIGLFPIPIISVCYPALLMLSFYN